MTAREVALAALIRAELTELEQVVDRAERLLSKAQADDDYLDGVALNLHGFYAGAERILEGIARDVDGSVPAGPEWHRDLLSQMTSEVTGIRPAVISPTTWRCLEDYRGFRHVDRNVYTLSLRPPRVRELGAGLRACYGLLAHDAREFCAFLEGLAPAGGPA